MCKTLIWRAIPLWTFKMTLDSKMTSRRKSLHIFWFRLSTRTSRKSLLITTSHRIYFKFLLFAARSKLWTFVELNALLVSTTRWSFSLMTNFSATNAPPSMWWRPSFPLQSPLKGFLMSFTTTIWTRNFPNQPQPTRVGKRCQFILSSRTQATSMWGPLREELKLSQSTKASELCCRCQEAT